MSSLRNTLTAAGCAALLLVTACATTNDTVADNDTDRVVHVTESVAPGSGNAASVGTNSNVNVIPESGSVTVDTTATTSLTTETTVDETIDATVDTTVQTPATTTTVTTTTVPMTSSSELDTQSTETTTTTTRTRMRKD